MTPALRLATGASSGREGVDVDRNRGELGALQRRQQLPVGRDQPAAGSLRARQIEAVVDRMPERQRDLHRPMDEGFAPVQNGEIARYRCADEARLIRRDFTPDRLLPGYVRDFCDD